MSRIARRLRGPSGLRPLWSRDCRRGYSHVSRRSPARQRHVQRRSIRLWRRPTRTTRRSTRSGRRCVRPTKTCRRRWPAIVRKSPSRPQVANRRYRRPPSPRRAGRRSIRRCSGYNSPFSTSITASQTLFNGFQTANRDPPGREPGTGRACDVAQYRAIGAARCRHRVHEPAARHGDSRIAEEQRRGVAGAAEADPRPLQRRRGDAHRRGAVGITVGPGAFVAAYRGVRTTRRRPPPTAR